MPARRLSLVLDAGAVYDEHRADYLAQLTAPMDDMWAAFADGAAHCGLCVDAEVVGSCAVDDERRLLRFHVTPPAQHHSGELLQLARRELDVAHMITFTQDPHYLGTALDAAARVESHSHCFAPVAEPEGPDLEPLIEAQPGDHERIVEFQIAAVGMPRAFLDGYVRGRLERRELLLHEQDGELSCVGELRRDEQQAGIAQVGLIVHQDTRGQGVGSRMLRSLVRRSRAEGLTPICSTEVTNLGARRAIERAGFRALHRVLRVEFAG